MARDLRIPGLAEVPPAVSERVCARPTHRTATRPTGQPTARADRVPPASDFGAAAHWRRDDGWDDDWADGRFADHVHL